MRLSVIAVALVLASCSSSTKVTKTASPDGQSIFILREKDRGACCSKSFSGTLRFDGQEKEVFNARGEEVVAQWDGDNEVILVGRNVSEYNLVARNLRSNPLNHDGSESGVFIVFKVTRD